MGNDLLVQRARPEPVGNDIRHILFGKRRNQQGANKFFANERIDLLLQIRHLYIQTSADAKNIRVALSDSQ
ncbi:hypothetical protein DSECCO2_550260 [anaerobic digester metagenome]